MSIGVYIRGMEMPKSCIECELCADEVCPFTGVEALNIERQADCPLVEMVKSDGGKWIWDEEIVPGNPYGSFKCSKCGQRFPFQTEYCPKCGRPMKEVNYAEDYVDEGEEAYKAHLDIYG